MRVATAEASWVSLLAELCDLTPQELADIKRSLEELS
jgi:hypothetical protein